MPGWGGSGSRSGAGVFGGSNSSKEQQQAAEQQQVDLQKEIAKRRGQSATYTQAFRTKHCDSNNNNAHATTLPIDQYEDEDVQSFLTEWYGRGIFECMNDMRQLLHDYPDTLAVHYALLVPNTVSFDAFWSRYYYKTSATTILKEWRQVRDDLSVNRSTLSTQIAPNVLGSSTLTMESLSLSSAVANTTKTLAPTPVKSQDWGGAMTNSDASMSSSPLDVWEERMAARAQIFHDESISDIVETIPEEQHNDDNNDLEDEMNVETNTSRIDESNDDLETIAIGFAASG